MHFWIPFYDNLVEQIFFSGPNSYEFPDEGVRLHVFNSGIDSGGREIDSGFFYGHGCACVSSGFVRCRR